MKYQTVKIFLSCAVFVLLITVMPAYAKDNIKLNLGPDLIYNGGFENGISSWHIPAKSAKLITGVSKSGNNSLYYSNTDPKKYRLFTQKINVRSGQKVLFSAWVKGKNIQGDSKGASVYMQSYGEPGYLTGSFPSGFTGTFNWKKVTGKYIVPANATRTSIGLYLGHNVTGQVWFDNISVRIIYPAAIKSHLQYPNYRGMFAVDSKLPWSYKYHINKHKNWSGNFLEVITVLKNTKGKILLTNHSKIKTDKEGVKVTINPPDNLPVGHYTLIQTVISPNGKQLIKSKNSIQAVKKMPKVYIDSQGFTVVNGKRFFPFGFYIGNGTSDSKNLKYIADGGFNTVLSYQYGGGRYPDKHIKDALAYMKNAQKYGLKVIYAINSMYPGYRHDYYGDNAFNVAKKFIKKLRNKPALLSWYTNDEMSPKWIKALTKMYNIVKKLDPDHPTIMVQNKTSDLKADAAVTDILASDPYPVGSSNLSQTSRRTKAVMEAANGAKGVWIVPQSMDWAVYHKDDKQHPPSLDELRNQAYQAIINGATGLIYYSYYDMMFKDYPRNSRNKSMKLFNSRWADCKAMAKELNKVIPVILENNKVALKLPAHTGMQAGAWRNGNKLLILLANPYYKQNSITFAPPQGWIVVNKNQGEIKASITNGKITFTLPSVGSGVFKLQKK